jgi:Domain of unknown function (DUF4304)
VFVKPERPFVDEASCHLRTRLGTLAHGRDTWWELDAPAGELAAVDLGG